MHDRLVVLTNVPTRAGIDQFSNAFKQSPSSLRVHCPVVRISVEEIDVPIRGVIHRPSVSLYRFHLKQTGSVDVRR